jgi:hypothetical protein
MFFNLFSKSTVERMCASWIDWRKHLIRVPASKAKNAEGGTYWLHPRAEKALRTAARERAPGEPIFGRFDHSNVFWGALERLGIASREERRGLTAHHVARRTAATLFVDAGVSRKIAWQQAGGSRSRRRSGMTGESRSSARAGR